MVDVFVSYAREDARRVEPLVAMLEANGRSVWWDRKIVPGQDYEREIAGAIADASSVLIALTEHAVESTWVRAEAAVGQEHNKLIPVLLDDVEIPLSLRALQVADLRGWPQATGTDANRLLIAVSARLPADKNLFVGRTDVMANLQTKLDEAIAGRGALAMLAGEPGIGKTRCAEEFGTLAEDQGALTLWGRCYEQPGAPPYWPWVRVIRDLFDAHTDDELRVLTEGHREMFATLIPELGSRIDLPNDPAVNGSEDDQRFRLFDAVAQILMRTSRNVPLAIVLDDIHWADASSLSLLEHLSKEIGRQRCLIVCTYRDVEVTRRSALRGTLGELARSSHVQRFHLSGLTLAETGELSTAVSGWSVAPSVAEAIFHQTDGNPLFVREVAQVLAEERRDAGNGVIAIEVPDGIRQAIGRRLDRLSDPCNALLRAASVIGRDFDLTVLAAVADWKFDELVRELDPVIQAGIVRRLPTPAHTYQFTHAVIRETLYDEIETLDRLHLHRRVGAALLKMFEHDLGPMLSEAAHHSIEASALGDYDTAVDLAMRAAARDERIYAYEEACRHYEAATNVLTSHGQNTDRRAAHAYFRLGRLYLHQMAQADMAFKTIAAGIAVARRLKDGELFERFVTLLMRVNSLGPQADAVALVEEGLRLLPGDATGLRASMLASLALALRSEGNVEAIERVGAEAIALASGVGDPDLTISVTQRVIRGLHGDARTLCTRLTYGREMLQQCAKATDQEQVAECHHHQLMALIQAGDVNAFTALLECYVELANHHRLAVHGYQAELLRIALNLLRGEWTAAEERIERTFERNQQMSRNDRFTAAEGVYGAQMFILNRELGRLQGMAPLVQHMVESGRHKMWAPGLMAMCTEAGLLDSARETFDQLATDDFARIPRDDVWLTSMVFCTETCARLQDAGRAAVLYDQLLPYVDQTANNPGAICFGSAALYLGMLAETLGRFDDAKQHYTRAIEKNRAMNAWPSLARAQLRLGRLLHAAGDAAAGRRLLGEAEQLAARLNMQGLVAEIGGILNDDASQLPDGLSTREAEVLKLLAIGRSNKDISKALAISLSTVASHVRSILTKSGCANRTEAAAYAMRNDLA